jgi:hypothetical protein
MKSGESAFPSQVAAPREVGPLSGPGPQPTRLRLGQALGWGLAFLVIAVLVILFFIFGRQVRPLLGARTVSAWLTNSS